VTTSATGTSQASEGPKDRRVLLHAISISFIILVALLLFYKHFATRGMLMHVDMTFPATISRNFALYNHTWWQYGSVQNIWNVQRVFWTYPLLAAVKLLNISTDRYLLILFIGTFALAGVSMYALAHFNIKRFKLGGTNQYAPYIGAVFAALIFMYNPFSVSHLWPYFGYPGYAVLPLVFLLLVKVMDSPKVWSVVLLALLITVAGTSPINAVWYWFMILAYMLFYLVTRRFNRKSLATTGKVLFPVAGLYGLLNAAWVMPYAASQVINKPFTPSYITGFSRSMLDTLSASGSLLNNLRFTAGWGLPVNPEPIGTLWVILSFALPAFALLAVVMLRRKVIRDGVALFWSIMFVVSLLLATGTSFILAGPYSWFVLRAPGLSSFGWVFRAADRWLVFAGVFYALILGLFIAYLIRNWKPSYTLLAQVIAVLVLVSFVPLANSYAKYVYNPTQIPADYAEANEFIEVTAPGARPVWLPFSKDGFRYNWAPEKRIGAFDVYSSNASLNNLQDLFNQDNFYYWLESVFSKTFLGPGDVLNRQLMLQKDLASRLFIPLSSRFLVFDSTVPGYAIGDSLREDTSMRSVLKTDDLEVFEFNTGAAVVRPTTTTILIDNYWDELALVQKLSPEQLLRTSFTSREAGAGKRLGTLAMDNYKERMNANPGFEEMKPDGNPVGWTLLPQVDSYVPAGVEPGQTIPPTMRPESGNAKVTMLLDTVARIGGKRSLKVSNYSFTDLSTYSIAGDEIPVIPGDIYNIETHVKYKNAEWTHVRVEGLADATGKWTRLASCPPIRSGTSRWHEHTCSFYMPAGISKIRPVLSAGWAHERKKGPGVSWFDNVKVSRISNRFFTELSGVPAPPEVSFKQVSPEKYEVTVRAATAPFVLAFGEAFDPLWTARLDGKTVDPVRLYSTINGFRIDKRGDFKMTIEYIPQGWFTIGMILSLVVLFLCLAYLGLVLVRRRHLNR